MLEILSPISSLSYSIFGCILDLNHKSPLVRRITIIFLSLFIVVAIGLIHDSLNQSEESTESVNRVATNETQQNPAPLTSQTETSLSEHEGNPPADQVKPPNPPEQPAAQQSFKDTNTQTNIPSEVDSDEFNSDQEYIGPNWKEDPDQEYADAEEEGNYRQEVVHPPYESPIADDGYRDNAQPQSPSNRSIEVIQVSTGDGSNYSNIIIDNSINNSNNTYYTSE